EPEVAEQLGTLALEPARPPLGEEGTEDQRERERDQAGDDDLDRVRDHPDHVADRLEDPAWATTRRVERSAAGRRDGVAEVAARSRDRRRDPSRRGASSCRTSRTAGRGPGPAATAAVARAAGTTRTVALRAAAHAGWRAAGSVRDGAINPARRVVDPIDHGVHRVLDHGRADVH